MVQRSSRSLILQALRSVGLGPVVFFVWVGLLAPLARATSFAPLPLATVVGEAPIIVRGRILGKSVDHAQGQVGEGEGQRQIYTFYRMTVDETLKGSINPGTAITFRELGGERDGIGVVVSGAAEFGTDENVLLFLTLPGKDGVYSLRGLMTGKINFAPEGNGSNSGKAEGANSDGILTGLVLDWDLQHDTDPASDTGTHSHDGGNNSKAGRKQWTLSQFRKFVSQAPDLSKSDPKSINSIENPRQRDTDTDGTSPRGIRNKAGDPQPKASPLQQNTDEAGSLPGAQAGRSDSGPVEHGLEEAGGGAGIASGMTLVAVVGFGLVGAAVALWVRRRRSR